MIWNSIIPDVGWRTTLVWIANDLLIQTRSQLKWHTWHWSWVKLVVHCMHCMNNVYVNNCIRFVMFDILFSAFALPSLFVRGFACGYVTHRHRRPFPIIYSDFHRVRSDTSQRFRGASCYAFAYQDSEKHPDALSIWHFGQCGASVPWCTIVPHCR